ncbi:hypothetical protein FQN60_016890 [Etheostoma spectabile]|uniref:Uncharacterized protein n=1 Tax=Etheostoma spectabile TaxID=54343 RepID=A0A5J5DDY7_9PERO|nr:hypothetical protein FQN60_016890 [Etheostoma spectabile]
MEERGEGEMWKKKRVSHICLLMLAALYGRCLMKTDESLAVWTLKGTSFSDNGTRVVCQQSNDPDAPAAVLHVYDNSASFVTLIGCVVGGFFGVLLVFGLLYIALRRSETLQKWFSKGKGHRRFYDHNSNKGLKGDRKPLLDVALCQ